jgi:hypothetical protein
MREEHEERSGEAQQIEVVCAPSRYGDVAKAH